MPSLSRVFSPIYCWKRLNRVPRVEPPLIPTSHFDGIKALMCIDRMNRAGGGMHWKYFALYFLAEVRIKRIQCVSNWDYIFHLYLITIIYAKCQVTISSPLPQSHCSFAFSNPKFSPLSRCCSMGMGRNNCWNYREWAKRLSPSLTDRFIDRWICVDWLLIDLTWWVEWLQHLNGMHLLFARKWWMRHARFFFQYKPAWRFLKLLL